MTTIEPNGTGAPGDAPAGISRRAVLGIMGAGAAVVAVGCTTPGPTPPGPTAPGPTTPPGGGTCRLTPEQTEGPYYLDGDLVRRNIIDGRPGTPLRLELLVQNPSCAPIAGAAVDVWHCDAAGAYSGFGAGAGNRTFLRGTQVAGADGLVVFETIYPGWYTGRAVHIHVKVHSGGREIHTGQLYVDDALSDTVYRSAPYSDRRGSRTRNASDFIYRNGGAESTLAVAAASSGYVGRQTLVVS